MSHFTFQLSLLRERKKKSVNFHFEKSFLSINSSSSLSLISHSLIGSLNIRLVPERFILLLWSVTLAALHRGARIMRVVAGRQTVLTSQLRPSLSRLKKNVNTLPYVLWIVCFSKTIVRETQLSLVMLLQFFLMCETTRQKQQQSKLKVVFCASFQFSAPSALPPAIAQVFFDLLKLLLHPFLNFFLGAVVWSGFCGLLTFALHFC